MTFNKVAVWALVIAFIAWRAHMAHRSRVIRRSVARGLLTLTPCTAPALAQSPTPQLGAGQSAILSKTLVVTGQYGGTTVEQWLTNTITAAVHAGCTFVYVPAAYLPYNASLVTFNSAIHVIREGSDPAYFDVEAYGADPIGTNNADASFTAAKAAAFATPDKGGTVYVPEGTFLISSFDMTTGPSGSQLTLRGAGVRATVLLSSATRAFAIKAASSSTRYNVLRDFALYQSARATPSATRAGNYGIVTDTTGVGYQLNIEQCEVDFFASDAILIHGPTGPTTVKDCTIQHNYGWGINTGAGIGGSPQNINILGGNIQDDLGGIRFNGVSGSHVVGTDVELGQVLAAQGPGVYLTGGSVGNSFVNVTTSLTAGNPALTPNAVRAIDSQSDGNVFYGGLDYCENGNGTNNYIIGENGGSSNNNTLIAGQYVNTAVGGGYYLHQTSAATVTTVINPWLVVSTYGSGKNVVHDAFGQSNFLVGITSDAHSQGFTAAGEFTATTLTQETTLTWGTSVSVGASLGNKFLLVATSNIAAVLQAPTNTPSFSLSQELVFEVFNNSGGALTTAPTFATGAGAFLLTAAPVNPRSGQRVIYRFTWSNNQRKYVEASRTVAF